MTIDLTDPWLLERSRAMHADLDATQDREAQTAIMRLHLDAALSSRGVTADDYAGFNDMLKDLYHAACPEPTRDARMLVGMGLMSPLDPRPPLSSPSAT
jgi:hypothetical protein